jgi:hypothetical protein
MARNVDEHIEPAEGFDRRLNGIACRMRVCDIEVQGADLIAVAPDQIGEEGISGNPLASRSRPRKLSDDISATPNTGIKERFTPRSGAISCALEPLSLSPASDTRWSPLGR